jgi:hypothetical protein
MIVAATEYPITFLSHRSSSGWGASDGPIRTQRLGAPRSQTGVLATLIGLMEFVAHALPPAQESNVVRVT